ncbi:hypothetical protein JTE90_028939 [Oedothorax gibbosus]|uniref:Alpha-carbonic anhydrase domain-containing protein n=1 Tax=Oedothorax gibbosus TaxID=931172 RepID=A0AAV6VIU0_9ARAC|nr:hypothetical protein JTE90_028939 [Oedothorax gibbosus]
MDSIKTRLTCYSPASANMAAYLPPIAVETLATGHFPVNQKQPTSWIKAKSRPDFWGLLNPEWSLCTKGRRQSPVDLDPEQILFDPYLRPLNISSHRDNSSKENNKQGERRFRVE